MVHLRWAPAPKQPQPYLTVLPLADPTLDRIMLLDFAASVFLIATDLVIAFELLRFVASYPRWRIFPPHVAPRVALRAYLPIRAVCHIASRFLRRVKEIVPLGRRWRGVVVRHGGSSAKHDNLTLQ